jgi:hypothetical protein
MLEELDQSRAAAGSSDQPVVRSNGEKLRRAIRTFAVEQVEGVSHVREKSSPVEKPLFSLNRLSLAS